MTGSEGTRIRNKVLVVTPVGIEGRGGIDRLNLYMSDHLRFDPDAPELVFLGSRGEWRGPLWVFHFLWSLVRFTAMLAGRGYDLVHIHVSTDGSAFRKSAFGWVARRFGVAYVIHFHGDFSQARQRRLPLWIRALANLAQGATYCIVLGQTFVDPFRDVLQVPAERIRIVHNGIPDIGEDAAIPRLQREEAHIMFSGEVGRRKGGDLLIGALGMLKRDAPAWRCTIAGNGDLAPWQKAVEEAGLADKIRFTGWLAISDIHALMRDADIAVLPSRAEALPLSLIEGASAGAALVSCDVGAVREIVLDNVNGLIVPHDARALGQAIDNLLRDPALRSRMQKASRNLFLKTFDMRIFVENILAVHRDVRDPGGEANAKADDVRIAA